MADAIIEIRDVKKKYKLGQVGAGTFRQELRERRARRKGKEDPGRRIGLDYSAGDDFYALNGISLTIYQGETVGIIGRNGAGKSTLLKLLCRVTGPTEGSIDLYGRVTSMLEVGTGFNGELTGRENIYINGAILGMTKAEVDKKMEDIIAFSEIGRFIDTPVKRYSSGMYTKLGFAVSVNLDSEVIIMDEVLAVGDYAFQNKCIEAMRQAAMEDGRTVLYVSHNMNHIRQLCTRCIVLEKGRVIFDGKPEDAIGQYLAAALNEDTFCDYTDYERPEWLKDNRMRLISARYRNPETNRIGDGEMMDLILKWRCLENVEKIGLRIEIQSMAEQRLGTYVLYDICDGKKGETIEAEVEVDVSRFRENTYKVIYCFFNSFSLGGNLNLDRVEGLSFTRVHKNTPGELTWDFTEWGSLSLEGASVTAVRKQQDREARADGY